MRRRRLLAFSLGGGAVLAAGGAGWLTYQVKAAVHPHLTTLAEVRAWFGDHPPSTLVSIGRWSPSQILNHCAQSLEYSFVGFPANKPPWFQTSLGALAFSAFRGLGGMKHDLAAVVPGSAESDLESDLESAVARLHRALDRFEDPGQELAPHFAYGRLSRQDFAMAHAMHISEHISELRPRGESS